MHSDSLAPSRTATAKTAVDVPAREILRIQIGRESYGIDILKVQEIRSYERPTALANAPAFIRGVIDLRGVIVPILDLRTRFQLVPVDPVELAAVIILNVADRTVGMVVDRVSDVLTLAIENIRPAPRFATVDMTYIAGLAAVEDRMLILLDIEKLLTGSDMLPVEEMLPS